MNFDPLTEQLHLNSILYLRGGNLHIEENPNKVKLFFRRVFLRRRYDQSKVYQAFQNAYINTDSNNLDQLKCFKMNCKTLDKSNHKKYKKIKSHSGLIRIILFILYGSTRLPSKEDLQFYKSKVENEYEIKIGLIKKILDDEKFDAQNDNIGIFTKFFNFSLDNHIPINYFAKVAENFFAFLDNSSSKFNSLSEKELGELFKQCKELLIVLKKVQIKQSSQPKLPLLISKLTAMIVSIDVQLESVNFNDEFKDVLEDDEDATIFDAVTACGELQLPYLSDFIKRLNSHLPSEKDHLKVNIDTLVVYTKVLEASALLKVEDYKNKKIFTAASFDQYLEGHAIQIRAAVKHLL